MATDLIKDYLRSILKLNCPECQRTVSTICDREELETFQQHRLTNLLNHALANVPYYQKVLNGLEVEKNETIHLSSFQEIPLLTKDIIRANFNSLISNDYMDRKPSYNTSGGSTGEPVRFVQDKYYQRWSEAVTRYYYSEILGTDWFRSKKVNLWGHLREIAHNRTGIKPKVGCWLTNTVFLSAFRMAPQDMERYIFIINSYKPDLIHGYAGSLHELSKYAIKNNLNLYTPRFIVSTAETLRDDMRIGIEQAFGTKVYNFYGSREVSNLAGECPKGLMHTFDFWNYLEIVDENNKPVEEGEEGRVVVTNLFNYSMPLIRYEIGDLAIRGPDQCGCGNFSHTIAKVTGRVSDPFVLEDGTIIYSYFNQLFYFKDWVHSFQIVQEEYKQVRIFIKLQGEINRRDQLEIEAQMRLVMGQDCVIIWDVVDEIPKTPSGKYLYRISYVWRDLQKKSS